MVLYNIVLFIYLFIYLFILFKVETAHEKYMKLKNNTQIKVNKNKGIEV